ncbi:MAG: hypothetical protein E7633_01805 [Ruminococcaceae bacterium]|nr:hypothetical protein [Oscillospiraceae bacterium]
MYKGYRRRVVVIRDTKSSLFESAYFVLRENTDKHSIRDMIKEASKIIREKTAEDECPASLKRFFSFSLGCAICSVLFTVIVIFFS